MPVRKRFGQHFLKDAGIVRRIVEAVAPQPGERLVEVGPGRGAITFSLLERAGSLDVIEIDRDLATLLKDDPRGGAALRVHTGDVLKTDFVALRASGPPLRLVGNLPYNISTPLLFHLLGQRSALKDMTFMLQKEVIDRMTAPPGGKEYGRLTVMLAAYSETDRLFNVAPSAFRPPPRVWSGVVRLKPSMEPRFPLGSDALLRSVVTAAFSQRRKTLRNGLKGLLSEADIESCGIDPAHRPETLSPPEFGRLASRFGTRQSAAAASA